MSDQTVQPFSKSDHHHHHHHHKHRQNDTGHKKNQPNFDLFDVHHYKNVILEICRSAYESGTNDLAKITFSYLKEDKLSKCQASDTRSPTDVDGQLTDAGVSTDMVTNLEPVIPDPGSKVLAAKEIIRYFHNPNIKFPCVATVAADISFRCKILAETLQFIKTVPKPPRSDVVNTDESLAAMFMRSTGGGPLDSSFFDGCSYNWASQYRATKHLSGLGKDGNVMSLHKEAMKPLNVMHSSTCIYIPLTTDRALHDDPVLQRKLHAFGGLAYLSDLEWIERQESEQDQDEQHAMAMEHCRLSNECLNAGFGYEKICEAQRQTQGELIQPAWLCSMETEERQRLLLAQAYGDYGMNCESHYALMEDEGRRSRGRIRDMIMGCNVDSYDEWVAGEANVSSALCFECFNTETRSACSPDHWESEDYDLYDRSVYVPMAYFIFSARHHYTLARLLRFRAQSIQDVLAKYNQFPEMVLKGETNSKLWATIASAIGVRIDDNELSDRIARQYDWGKISGLCSRCNQDGASSDWYMAAIGAGLSSKQLTLLETVRLAHYLDSCGWNVFPALHRSYLSGCGCVGRWIKRCHMVLMGACQLWEPASYSSVFALRDAVAGSIEDLDDSAIAELLQSVNKEVQRGRRLGQEYRERREEQLATR